MVQQAASRSARGFSLVEMLSTLVVVALVVTVAVPIYQNNKQRAYTEVAQQDGSAVASEVASQLTGVNFGSTAGTISVTGGNLVITTGAGGDPVANVPLKVSPSTTASGVVGPGGDHWCVAVTNTGKTAVYTENGIQPSATSCASDGTVDGSGGAFAGAGNGGNGSVTAITISYASGLIANGSNYATVSPTVANGTGTKKYSYVGTLPSGVTFSTATGVFTGPASTGWGSVTGFPATIAVTVTDGSGSATASVTLVTSLSIAYANQSMSYGSNYATVTPTVLGGNGVRTFSYTGTLPRGVTFNTANGVFTGPASAWWSTSTGWPASLTVTVTDSSGSASAAVTLTYVTPVDISYASTSFVTGSSQSTLSPTITGGSGTRSYRLVGTLPTGVSFSTSTGQFTGPTVSGWASSTGWPATVTVTVTDATGSKSVTITLTKTGAQPIAFSYPTLSFLYGANATTYNPTVSYGNGAQSWAVSSGTLPSGVTLNATTGVITGPTTSGWSSSTGWPATVTISVTDSTGTASQSVTLSQSRNVEISYASTVFAYGTNYATLTPTTSYGSGTRSYAISGTLPTGVTFSPVTGVFTGPSSASWPASGFPAAVTVTVTDSSGSASTSITLRHSITLTYASTALTYGQDSQVLSATTTGGQGTAAFSYTGALPTGVSFNTSTGALTGPSAAAWPGSLSSFPKTITVTVSDASGSASKTIAVSTTAQPLTLTYPNDSGAGPGYLSRGAVTQLTPTLTNGSGTRSFSYTGTLPTGVTFNSSTGVFTGPKASGWNFQVKQIAVGETHSCALTVDGGFVYCWGKNDRGQLGDGTTTDRSTPVQVLTVGSTQGVNPFYNVTAISVGFSHTCAITWTSQVRCWGSNNGGQLGDGTSGTDRLNPVQVLTTGSTQGANVLTGATGITAGYGDTCILMSDTTVRCAGLNSVGQLGNGTTTAASNPTTVVTAVGTPMTGATAVTLGGGVLGLASGGHGCALMSDTTIRCWGLSMYGARGDGTAASGYNYKTTASNQVLTSGSTQGVNVYTGATSIDAGYGHTCATTSTMTVYCWGLGSSGELGNGATGSKLNPVQVLGSGSTPDVDVFGNVTSVSAGLSQTCARTESLTLYCWGLNTNGQLGDGTSGTNRLNPVQVLASGSTQGTDQLSGVQSFAAGAFTCATLTSGTVNCWGANANGQLGDGTLTARSNPVTTTQTGPQTGYPTTLTVTATDDTGPVSTGLTLTTSTDVYYTTGAFTYGTGGQSITPTLTNNNCPCTYSVTGTLPTGVTFNTSTGVFTGPTAGQWATSTGWPVTLTVDVQDSVEAFARTQVTLYATNRPLSISYPSTLLPRGSNNAQVGPLIRSGAGTRTFSYTGTLPTGVTFNTSTGVFTGPTASAWNFQAVQIAGTASHTCALTGQGTVYCWGDNTTGQLGDGTTTQRLTPVQVLASGSTQGVNVLTGVVDINVSGSSTSSTCALTSAATLYCWGDNTTGQLGDGTTTQRLNPVRVLESGTEAASPVELSGVTEFAISSGHACAVLSDTTVRCWGDASSGQLGDGTSQNNSKRLNPVKVLTTGSVQTSNIMTGAVDIAVGTTHSCALMSDTTVRCWGAGGSGQVGDGLTTAKNANPRNVLTTGTNQAANALTAAVSIDAGGTATCAVKSDTGAYCWGSNSWGELGDGTTTQRLNPVQVLASAATPFTGITTLDMASTLTCASTSTGQAYCWGSNGYGQLGDGTTTISRPYPTQVLASGSTQGTNQLGGVVSVASAGSRSCFLLGDGAVLCAGQNPNGQIGDGTSGTNRLNPVATSLVGTTTLTGSPTVTVTDSTGSASTTVTFTTTAAVTYPIASRVFTTGANSQTLAAPTVTNGSGTRTFSYTGALPTSVTFNTATGRFTGPTSAQWASSTGWPAKLTVSMTDATGTVSVPVVLNKAQSTTVMLSYPSGYFAIGSNNTTLSPTVTGGSGTKTYSYTGTLPSNVTFNSTTGVFTGPGASQWNGNAIQVASGDNYSCVLMSSGQIYCWGDNARGQLGDGTTTARANPVQVLTSGSTQGSNVLVGATAIAARGTTTCALMRDTTVYCWGYNWYATVGDGTSAVNVRANPVQVLATGSTQGSNVFTGATAIARGANHTCAVVSSGSVYCWGYNNYGQVGNGTVASTLYGNPVQVTGLSTASKISANQDTTCAVTTAATIYCWGYSSSNGETGTGASTPSGTPGQVLKGVSTPLTSVSSVSVGVQHSCAIDTGTKVWCWGNNQYNQLAQSGPYTASGFAVAALLVAGIGLDLATAVSAGRDNTCVIRDAGKLYCWGANPNGQVGIGTASTVSVPTQVQLDASTSFPSASTVTAGYGHTCAITTSGGTYCWGANTNGQLGDGRSGSGVDRVYPGQVLSAGSTQGVNVFAGSQALALSTFPGNGTVTVTDASGSSSAAVTLSTDVQFSYPSGFMSTTVSSPTVSPTVTSGTGTGTRTWSYTGTLPTNVTFNTGTGTFTGPTSAQWPSSTGWPASITVTATDANGSTASQTVSLTKGAALSASYTSPTFSWGANNPTISPTVSGGSGTLTYSYTGTLPPYVTFDPATGVFTGASAADWNSSVAEVERSMDYACARMTTGQVYCWGYNYNGQLGDGTTTNRAHPVQVLTSGSTQGSNVLTGATALAVAGSYACAVLSDTTVYCWGANTYRQLGDGTTTARRNATQVLLSGTTLSSPVPLTGASTALAAATDHACVVMLDTTIRCWGWTQTSMAVYGAGSSASMPANTIQVLQSGSTQGTNVLTGAGGSLATDDYRTCVVMLDTTARCWGYGPTYGGYFGDGGVNTTQYNPVQVLASGTIQGVNALTGVTQIDLGTYNTAQSPICALMASTKVYCWGSNSQTSVGNGSMTPAVNPVPVLTAASTPLTGATSVSVDQDYVCASLSTGGVSCWGRQAWGSGTSVNSGYALQVLTAGSTQGTNVFTGATSVSTSAYGPCATMTDGSVTCWGTSANGALGNEQTSNSYPAQVLNSGSTPGVNVFYGTPASYLPASVTVTVTDSTGSTTTSPTLSVGLGFRYASTTFSPTSNSQVRAPSITMGAQTPTFSYTGTLPTSVTFNTSTGAFTGPSTAQWASSTGWPATITVTATNASATVARTVTLTKAPVLSLAYSSTQVTPGSERPTLTPTVTGGSGATTFQVTGGTLPAGFLLSPSTGTIYGPNSSGWDPVVTQVATGGQMGCALTAAGHVFCWGDGMLGDGNPPSTATYPVQVENSAGTGPLSGIAQVAVGTSHACALTATGSVYCWGGNTSGQLGNGDPGGTGAVALLPVQVLTTGSTQGVNVLTGVRSISAGGANTCALLTDGTALCWGNNVYGQLANGVTNTTTYYPNANQTVTVSGGATLTGITQIDMGGSHACAVTSDTVAYCWGYNWNGQIGQGTNVTAGYLVATSVKSSYGGAAVTGFAQISAGGSSTCAVKTDKTVYCWGLGTSGQLGDNSNTSKSAPVQVLWSDSGTAVPFPNATSVSVGGGQHACATTTTGTVYCWGNNASGQVGRGTIGGYTMMASTDGSFTGALDGGSQVDTGGSSSANGFTCTVTAGNGVSCWGENGSGQLGDQTTTSGGTPETILPWRDELDGSPFTVTVTDAAGQTATASVTLTALYKPTAPLGITVTSGSGTLNSVVVSWNPPASAGSSAVSSYTATLSPGGATCTTATTSCTFSGLTTGTAYSATVTATSATGTSPAGQSVSSGYPNSWSATGTYTKDCTSFSGWCMLTFAGTTPTSTFTTTFTLTGSLTGATVIVVGSGGGSDTASTSTGGGGGAGGVGVWTSQTLSGSYAVTGGAARTTALSGNSSGLGASFTAGGGGVGGLTTATAAGNGTNASGGGGGGGVTAAGTASSSSYGYAGGAGVKNKAGGGGGGAGGIGAAGTSGGTGGAGGACKNISFGTNSIRLAGGGGGTGTGGGVGGPTCTYTYGNGRNAGGTTAVSGQGAVIILYPSNLG